MLYLHLALDHLIAFEDKLGDCGFHLMDEDWILLGRLAEILELFITVSVHLSESQYPSLHLQLPYFNILLQALFKITEEEKDEDEDEGNETLAAACEDGYNILNKYWKKTDTYSTQVISMILDPRFKLHIFKNLSWQLAWTVSVRKKFERVYSTDYDINNDASQILD